jgi:penicillin-binding protein 1A
MVRIDRRSGRKVFGTWPTDEPKAAVIWEAFKPESEPRRSIRRDQVADAQPAVARAKARRPARSRPRTSQAQESDFLQREGGIY